MQDFFERTVFRSPSGGSEYDPHTYTMHINQPESNPFGSVGLHEVLHWIQYICYTFGGFINASIHMSDDLAICVLLEYAEQKDFYQKHQVLFSLPDNEAFFHITFGHEKTAENIYEYQSAWRDLLICKQLFLYMSKHYEEGKGYKGVSSAHQLLQPELLIPRALVLINNWAIDTLDYRSTEPQGPLEITDFANHPKLINFGRARYAGIELDTDDIIEGMSVACEIYHLQRDKMGEGARKRMKKIRNTSYERAIKVFLEIMGFSVKPDNIGTLALMFLAIAEMSLNPPLPPFAIIDNIVIDWNKIYPPRRFIELCQIAKRKAKRVLGVRGYKLDPHPYSWIFDWMALVETLYLAQGGMFNFLDRDIDGYLPNEKSVPFLALIAEENSTMRLILKKKGLNTIGMAEKFPEVMKYCTGIELYAMLRHAHVLFMKFFLPPRPFLVPLFETRLDTGDKLEEELYLPPLVVSEDGDGPYGYSFGWTENFLAHLINFNLCHYPLHNIMLGKNPPIYLPNFPLIDDEWRKVCWDHVRKSFSHIF